MIAVLFWPLESSETREEAGRKAAEVEPKDFFAANVNFASATLDCANDPPGTIIG